MARHFALRPTGDGEELPRQGGGDGGEEHILQRQLE